MIGELAISGIFIPRILVELALAFALSLLLRWVLRSLHLYRFIWHAGLFDTAVFVALACLIAKAGAGFLS